MRWHTGNGSDPGAKFGGEKNGATAEAAANVKHLAAQSGWRPPYVGRIAQDTFLSGHQSSAQILR